jgi:hypothetical protein
MVKLRAEFGVDPEVFLSNPTLLRQVKIWIDIAGVDYARKTSQENIGEDIRTEFAKVMRWPPR